VTSPRRPYQPPSVAADLRRLFEDLGPTYIKFGQIIASSPGLFPDALSSEFQKCLDRVPPFPVEQVHRILEQDLGKPPEQLFASFTPVPIAAASIAQVHAATLLSGEDVVVKVQRPGIADRVDGDLFFMKLGARVVSWASRRARAANIVGIVLDFSTTIHEEMDFRSEAKNMDEFNSLMRKHNVATVRAPRVHWELTTRHVLTMERFYGFKADDIEAAREHELDTEKHLRIGMRAWLLTVLLHGFFHGDVHAGNLMFLPATKEIGFLDFGIIGRFSEAQRHMVMRYILSFAAQDFEGLARTLVEMGSAPPHVDIEAFGRDLEDTYSPLLTMNLADIPYGDMIAKSTRTALRYGVTLPREFLLILKQMLFFDRYARLAAPNLNVFNDIYLVDFLFTPVAKEAGIDTAAIMGLLLKIQARTIARSEARA
jgi:predicted unusual protein kinase regulating ubiquinone biosynthesis (AarF/ABC1/UbiB family)